MRCFQSLPTLVVCGRSAHRLSPGSAWSSTGHCALRGPSYCAMSQVCDLQCAAPPHRRAWPQTHTISLQQHCCHMEQQNCQIVLLVLGPKTDGYQCQKLQRKTERIAEEKNTASVYSLFHCLSCWHRPETWWFRTNPNLKQTPPKAEMFFLILFGFEYC